MIRPVEVVVGVAVPVVVTGRVTAAMAVRIGAEPGANAVRGIATHRTLPRVACFAPAVATHHSTSMATMRRSLPDTS